MLNINESVVYFFSLLDRGTILLLLNVFLDLFQITFPKSYIIQVLLIINVLSALILVRNVLEKEQKIIIIAYFVKNQWF